MLDPTPTKRKPGRPRMQFKTEITVNFVPLPPERAAAYWNAWRMLFEVTGMIPNDEGEPCITNTQAPTIP